jgi:hypothetical protein
VCGRRIRARSALAVIVYWIECVREKECGTPIS